MKRYLTLNKDNVVIGVRFGTESVTGEVESELGDLGQVLLDDGSFESIKEEVINVIQEPTNSHLAQMINELKIDLIIAGVI